MKTLVPGGTGWVGRAVCAALAGAGHEVVAVARRRVPVPDGVRLCTADASSGDLAGLLARERPDAVVNAAGGYWTGDPAAMRSSFGGVTGRLLEALGDVRLVQLGTLLEYVPPEPGALLTEASPTRPDTEYGRIKLADSEAVLRAAADAVVLRLPNVCGPGAPEASLPGRVVAQLRSGAEVLELSALRTERDYVDVRDVAAAVVAAVRGRTTGVVNLGTGTPVPVRSLVQGLIRATGRPVRLVERAVPDGPVPGGLVSAADPARARALLGWSATIPLERSLRDHWAEVQGGDALLPRPVRGAGGTPGYRWGRNCATSHSRPAVAAPGRLERL
ncbi:NAD(P)-dependent oxidoreductase [Streptomyces sp. ET3-23]|uniref:NAD-dependent epimerase/dehydratase family protein n=1 Tax=Streptomyces sp. ET3-23 TaxID=2885643 RepID=UPI001D10148B|nr:NAD(P)-dependent oxidoreductase [Streptomyces sp. ET3-23]MCC2274791.1 NAD(P)-dependent oxidoreductase [Streptomyces sp. ET3-23]